MFDLDWGAVLELEGFDMDLELVISTILTWMKTEVETLDPRVRWLAATYTVYLFFRGNWTVLRDLAKGTWCLSRLVGLHWLAKAGWNDVKGIVAWKQRKWPSKYAVLAKRCEVLESQLKKLPMDVQTDPEPPETVDEPLPPPQPDLPPTVTKENREELQRKIDATMGCHVETEAEEGSRRLREERQAAAEMCRQADLQAQVARARRDLDGGLKRNEGAARATYVGGNIPHNSAP